MPENNTYWLDIKIYERANMFEVPFRLPGRLMDMDGMLIPGTYSIGSMCTEVQFEEFMEWASNNQMVMKVLGTERING